MDTFNALLDRLWYGLIAPVVLWLGRVLEGVLVVPLASLGIPVWLHLVLLAALLTWGSFTVRKLLRVEERVRRFNEEFGAMREEQQQLQLIEDRHSRNAMYRSSDEELNKAYNNFLAHHYGRYVLVYLLPLFLTLAWLNQVFSPAYLSSRNGHAFALELPAGMTAVEGLGVNAVFLPAYICCLVIGFRILRRRRARAAA